MVSIKKKSHRQPARLRYRIEKKVSAYHKKQRKEAKKNPQKHKKKEKNIRIPNNFPYKNRILSEIEAKNKFKLKKSQDNEHVIDPSLQQVEMLLDYEKMTKNNFKEENNLEFSNIEEEVASWYGFSDEESNNQKTDCIKKETSLKAHNKTFLNVIDISDIILYVLDSRDPEGTRSQQVEKLILQNHEKKLVFILNKIDLIPHAHLTKWLTYLRTLFPCLPLRASASYSSHSFNHHSLSSQSTASDLVKFLKSYAHKLNLKRIVSVGVLGYPNVGKSSVINTIVSCMSGSGKKNPCTTGPEAGITTSMQQVKLDNKIKLIDSPGVVFPSKKKTHEQTSDTKIDEQARLILINAIAPSNIIDPIYIVSKILERLRSSPVLYKKLEETYHLPPILPSNGDITTDFLVHVARKKGRLGKGGIPNLESAAKAVINDWCTGKIQWWTDVPNQHNYNDTNALQTNGSSFITKDEPIIVSNWSKTLDLDAQDTIMEM